MIILINKMSECHKHVLVTELIFCNNSKANIKKKSRISRVMQLLGWPTKVFFNLFFNLVCVVLSSGFRGCLTTFLLDNTALAYSINYPNYK